MKVKENCEDPKKINDKTSKKNAKIKKKSKKTENFQVKIPRIIVRNLNFKIDENLLKKSFEESTKSSVKTVSVVTKDGKAKGFGFITFEKLEEAQKAIETMNGKKILGRSIAVDWSLPKDVYQQMQEGAPQPESYGIQSTVEVEKEEENLHEDEDEDEDEEEDLDEEEEKPKKIYTSESSRDVREHRTLFVRNIPFDATEEQLRSLFNSKDSCRIVSCRLVIDPVSRHPRGSAFVQFSTREEAEQCLNQSWTLNGQDLQIDFALSRQDLVKAREIREEKYDQKRKRDQRNLALANYGVILSLDELDGDENDLRKRQQLEDAKRQKLKNSLFFVSETRLTIHNLPANTDDKSLRNVVLRTLKKNGVALKEIQIVECRVMKKSKEAKKSLSFGFLSLSNHEAARRVIDVLNNNKTVFGPHRRPIVQFALENRRALQLKEERLERIKAKQNLLKDPTTNTIQFDNKKNKKNKKNLLDSTKPNVRLSQLIQEKDEETANDEPTENVPTIEQENSQGDETSSFVEKKRRKRKLNSEIRDQFDEFIVKTRFKPSLPEKKKKKWFE